MSDTIQSVFISGANRGIGYELVQQLSSQSYQVIAGYRDENRAEALLAQAQVTSNVFPIKADVTLENDLKDLFDFITHQVGSLDVLINNAGINLNRTLPMNDLELSDLAYHFEVNVGGAFLTAKYLYPLLHAGRQKKIINISSKLGSIELNSGGPIPYSISKAGLNMLTKHQAFAYKAAGITVVSLSPGWVRTDMGGDAAPLSVEESATRIIDVLDSISIAQSGQFINIDGERLPY